MEIDDAGMILVGGSFSAYQGELAPGIVRLFQDGSRDYSFETPGGAIVHDIVSLPGGRVAYCGNFSAPTNGVALVDRFGSALPAFQPGEGAGGATCLDLLPDGRLVVGGKFSEFNGTLVPSMACLLPNGAIDTVFHTALGVGPDNEVLEVRALPDGKLLVCGSFGQFSGQSLSGVAKLNLEGSVESAFGSSGIDIEFISASR
ncbi:MAG: delta-60 repeat domain-containing protein [Verrucomicrobiales bacterium]|nr:delta-60 repeat domain-containing protein [Verrucomicrobiales bacterium]